jgi:threonyl-tRNA synthetase
LLQKVYRDFGFHEVIYKVATRPEKRVGSEELWDKAENALIESLKRSGCAFEITPGEGAFYGPKIEYTLKDAIGRPWQCGTIQVDFSMPVRLEAEYVADDNTRKVPVMLHRAILGSLERFIGTLIENHAGALPLWLSPVQVSILNITDGQANCALKLEQTFKKQGFRVQADLRNEKITYKIREHSIQKIPYIIVVGDKEREANTVAVRARGNVDLGVMSVDSLVERLQQEIATKA